MLEKGVMDSSKEVEGTYKEDSTKCMQKRLPKYCQSVVKKVQNSDNKNDKGVPRLKVHKHLRKGV